MDSATPRLRVAAGDVKAGYGTLPHWINGLGLPTALTGALSRLVSMCHGPHKIDCPSRRQIRDELAVSKNTADRYLEILSDAGLIARMPNPAKPGGSWKLVLLFDPADPKPPYRLTAESDQFRHFPRLAPLPKNWVGVYPESGEGYTQNLGRGPDSASLISTRVIQKKLFETTTTTETAESSSLENRPEPLNAEVAGQAAKLFPEVASDWSRLESEITDHGLERVALGLELAQLLARDAKRKPRIFRWLPGVLAKWRGRSIESIRAELDAMRGPKRPEPVYFSAADRPAVSSAPPELIKEWASLIARGKRDEAEALMARCPAAKKKPAAEPLAKDSPQPEQETVGVINPNAAGPLARPANGAEGDRTLNLRIANAKAFRPPEFHATTLPGRAENTGRLPTERRILNAALSPDGPDPLDYTAESSLDQNHPSGPGD
jgi:hypothetical protein